MGNGNSPADGTGAREPWRVEMRRLYAATLAAKLQTLEALVGTLVATPEVPEARERLRDAVHKIRGSAGAYGFGALSDVAAEGEAALDQGAGMERVRELMGRLAEVIRAALDEEDGGGARG